MADINEIIKMIESTKGTLKYYKKKLQDSYSVQRGFKVGDVVIYTPYGEDKIFIVTKHTDKTINISCIDESWIAKIIEKNWKDLKFY